jgi:hypothetical protein
MAETNTSIRQAALPVIGAARGEKRHMAQQLRVFVSHSN